jgi:phosphatidylinositol kinase/protein kinase (PI-3  family)
LVQDRHNGNVHLDSEGHIIHIDYDFCLGLLPGGDFGFESAPFKLNSDMIEVMNGRDSQLFKLFSDTFIRAFSAAQDIADTIVGIVASFMDSGLPCFRHDRGQQTINLLNHRLLLNLSDCDKRDRLVGLIDRATGGVAKGLYDKVQTFQQGRL